MQRPRIKLVLLLVALAAPAPVVAMCQPEMADVAVVESTLRGMLRDDFSVNAAQVDCPSEVEWSTGDTFKCIAEVGRGSQAFSTVVTVTMQTDDGEWIAEY